VVAQKQSHLIIGLSGKKGSGKDTCGDFLVRHLGEHIAIKMSFAKKLKDVCCELLGVFQHQLYGDLSSKNSKTLIRWESLPHYSMLQPNLFMRALGQKPPTGFMTAREVMQQVGSMFRLIDENVWVNATLRECHNYPYSIICDVRYPNEVDAILKSGGKVIRLTRQTDLDTHSSEIALDNYKKFSAIIDNQNLTVKETNDELLRVLNLC
jgi:hypothetical protein